MPKDKKLRKKSVHLKTSSA